MYQSKPMSVLLDMDSIIVDIWGPWFEHYRNRTGDDLKLDSITAWNIPEAKDPKTLFAIIAEPGFYQGLQPFKGAVEAVRTLVEAGDDVHILSAAPSLPAWSEKAWWCEKFLPFVPQKNLIFTHAKHLVKGNILFDDGPHNLAAYRRAWPQTLLATIEYPYNRVEALDHANRIVGTWRDIPAAWAEFTRWTNEVRKYVRR